MRLQTCQLPALSRVSPASGPTGHATLLTVHGSGFFAAGALITYTKQVLGLDTSVRLYTYVIEAVALCDRGCSPI